jgi:chorismate mutase
MNLELPPKELLEAREKIDKIDRGLVELLGERFQLTHQVGRLKANQSLSSLDKSREAQKLAEVRLWCEEESLSSDLVVKLFRCIMEEVVKNHENLRNQ